MRLFPLIPTSRTRDPLTNLIDGFFSDSLPELFTDAQLPRTNIAETADHYLFELELPGLADEDIHVEVKDRQLTVVAQRKDETRSEGREWHRIEHRYGQFARTFALPKDARTDDVQATYKRGVLALRVGKAPEAKPTRVQIKAE